MRIFSWIAIKLWGSSKLSTESSKPDKKAQQAAKETLGKTTAPGTPLTGSRAQTPPTTPVTKPGKVFAKSFVSEEDQLLNHYGTLDKVPKENHSKALYRAAIKRDKGALDKTGMSYSNLDEKIVKSLRKDFLEEVKRDGRALERVPTYFTTKQSYPPADHQKNVIEMNLAAVNQDPTAIEFVPEDLQGIIAQDSEWARWDSLYPKDKSDQAPLTARTSSGLRSVPKEYRNLEVCRRAVQKDGRDLQFVPKEFWSELCSDAVGQNSQILPLLPKKLHNKALYLVAINNDKKALDATDTSYSNLDTKIVEEIRKDFLKEVEKDGRALKRAPTYFTTNKGYFDETHEKNVIEMNLAAVNQNPTAIEFVPYDSKVDQDNNSPRTEWEVLQFNLRKENVKARENMDLTTPRGCFEAVQKNGLVLQLIPRHLRTETLYLTAVQQNGLALQCVPKELRTQALCSAAVKQTGKALQFVPPKLHNKGLYLEASKDPVAFFYMDKKIIPSIKKDFLDGVKKDGLTLRNVPSYFRDSEEFSTAAVQQNGLALEHVLDRYRTETLCTLAVNQNADAINFVPYDLQKQVKKNVNWEKKEADFLAKVKTNKLPLSQVPRAFRTEALCDAALANNSLDLEFVPHSLRTEARCTAAVGGDIAAFKFVPENLKYDVKVNTTRPNGKYFWTAFEEE